MNIDDTTFIRLIHDMYTHSLTEEDFDKLPVYIQNALLKGVVQVSYARIGSTLLDSVSSDNYHLQKLLDDKEDINNDIYRPYRMEER